MAYGLSGANLLSGIGEGLQQASQTMLQTAFAKKRLDLDGEKLGLDRDNVRLDREKLEKQTAHQRRLLSAQVGWRRGLAATGAATQPAPTVSSRAVPNAMAPSVAPSDQWEQQVGPFILPAARPIDAALLRNIDERGDE